MDYVTFYVHGYWSSLQRKTDRPHGSNSMEQNHKGFKKDAQKNILCSVGHSSNNCSYFLVFRRFSYAFS